MWIRSGSYGSIRELAESRPGAIYDIPDYMNKADLPHICGLDEGCKLLKSHIEKAKRGEESGIAIVTDYDADGITSGTIMKKTIDFLTGTSCCRLVCPNRFSDGYGVSMQMIDSLISDHTSLIILTDNGITKNDEVKKARDNGADVLIIDHHLPSDNLPDATVIIDPWATGKSEFNDYCAAGLAYRMARLLLSTEVDRSFDLERELLFLSAIGTVSDMVPLLNENRVIVKEGLSIIPENWSALIDELLGDNKSTLTTDDVGFTVGPCLNSVGRYGILDEEMLGRFCFGDSELGKLLRETNQKRKEDTAVAVQLAEQLIERYNLQNEKMFILYIYPAYQGVLGIASSNIAQKYKRPVILLSSSEENKWEAVGSARSYGNFNIKEMLDKCSEKLIKYGGHSSAAGLSLNVMDIGQFTKMALYNSIDITSDNVMCYDFEINTSRDLGAIYSELEKYGPYGIGNPAPVFKINNYQLFSSAKDKAQIIGRTKEHIRLNGVKYSATYFGGAKKYYDLGKPDELTLYGKIKKQVFHSRERIEIEVMDIEPVKVSAKRTALADRIASLFD